jgi:maltose alpha-D-glucosyltransferase/alpha-amylase
MDALPQVVTQHALDKRWYKDAILYQLHVKAFADSNNDGIGDFAGLASKLDYLQELGVTAIWLLPFYPSPGRDDGYDIADYNRVNPDFGTMSDFRKFVQEAKRRDLRVITELVINHTSDQHRWFQRARVAKPGSDARNWYVWSDDPEKYAGTRIIFRDTETSNWAWDPAAGAYYWHRFFSHQPDLNFDNPRVLDAILKVMHRWLEMGVDGFRLDAIPYLCEREGTSNENLPETHSIIKQIRAEIDRLKPDGLLLAEANQWPEDVSAYFGEGEGDECHMAYHFPLMPRIYMAIAQEDRFPITDILRQTPEIPEACQWALFLRNHDELTLEMVTDAERDYLWSTYATDPRARLNLGIRRRLAPLMGNDRRKIELMNALLLSFPGTPIIYYGDEIGMGDNIYLGDRNGVRTPMQWTSDRNGGFSRCDPARLYLPMIMDPVYGYEAVNVEAQSRSLGSLLSWMKRLIGVRRSTPAFGRGSLTFLRPKNRTILAYIREYKDDVFLCVANLSRSAQAAEIDLSPWRGRVPLELLGRTEFPAVGEHPYVVTVAPYGFFWFQLLPASEPKDQSPSIVPEFETLVFRHSWQSLEQGHARTSFENAVLPAFLSTRRWFANRGKMPSVRLQCIIPSDSSDLGVGIALLEATVSGKKERYALPLTVSWKRFASLTEEQPIALAAVRRGPREGALLDAATDPAFVADLLRKVREGAKLEFGGGLLEFHFTRHFAQQELAPLESIRPVQTEQSNTTAIVGSDYVVKVFRRIERGANPEVEIGQFLTDIAGFTHAPPLLGWVDVVEGETRSTLAVVHGFVENQGDLWTVTNAYLDRFVEEQRLLAGDTAAESNEKIAYRRIADLVGGRLADLQEALASRDDVPEFAPEWVSESDVRRWVSSVQSRAERALSELDNRRTLLRPEDCELVDALLDQASGIKERIADLLPEDIELLKIRHHGDLHLGQILAVKDDVVILDFEGEPRRSLAERRSKAPAARDVAGIIRSIDYSATAALQKALSVRADDEARIASALDEWREYASTAFIEAYRHALTADGLWPEEAGRSARLLDFFLLEKAFYEIRYELAHRPNWLRVPLAGTLRILSSPETVA